MFVVCIRWTCGVIIILYDQGDCRSLCFGGIHEGTINPMTLAERGQHWLHFDACAMHGDQKVWA